LESSRWVLIAGDISSLDSGPKVGVLPGKNRVRLGQAQGRQYV